MINGLHILNFKCFENLRLTFGQLTLLTGFNAGGKSTAIQPLLLLAQALRVSRSATRFPLNGSLIQLGTAGDVLPSDPRVAGSSTATTFTVSSNTDEVSWRLTGRAGDRHLQGRISPTPLQGGPSRTAGSPRATASAQSVVIPETLAHLSYLSAVRAGSEDSYPMPDSGMLSGTDVGNEGQFAPYWYDQYVDAEVPINRRHPSESATTFRKQADAWLGSLFSGAQVSAQLINQVSQLSLSFRTSEIGAWRRPANVGYGLSYSFPIIAALLAAEEDQVIVIDSPEAHLHPFAQSQMGRMLAHFAAAGLQLVVESHSDHLLNGIRLAVKEGVLGPSTLTIHFFTSATAVGHGVTTPAIDINGRLNEWPNGFFDQAETDLTRLAE